MLANERRDTLLTKLLFAPDANHLAGAIVPLSLHQHQRHFSQAGRNPETREYDYINARGR